MGGLSSAEIDIKRRIVIAKIKAKYGEDTEIIDSNFNFPGMNALYYLAKSLEVLSQADLAYFCDDWKQYRGCTLEHQCCEVYGIPTEYEFN